MTAPTKELEKLVMSGRLSSDRNPAMRWMAGNTAVETDAAGNLKPSKKKSTDRIDGMVALVMALGIAIAEPAKRKSVYETRGVRQV
jgi:phage terminase large subunit-like protein